MKKRTGFTLIELIVVLAILAIVAAIAVPTAFSSIEKARAAACAASENSLQSAWRVEAAHETLGTGDADYTEEAVQQMLQAVVENCEVADKYDAGTQKITGLCPSGGTYTLTVDAATGSLAIVCSKHDMNAVQKQLSDISSWIAEYNKTHPIQANNNATAAVMKDYMAQFGYVNTPLTGEELSQIFGDEASQITRNAYLRPLPVNINGAYANVQYVSQSAVSGDSGQVSTLFRSYAIIVDGVIYVHHDSKGNVSNGYTANGRNIADFGKGSDRYSGFASTEEFVNYLTQNGEFVKVDT